MEKNNLTLLSPARMDAASRPECLPGTRVELLKSITEWLLIPSPDANASSSDAHPPSPPTSNPHSPMPKPASLVPDTPSPGPNILWLSGVAGAGKSTIATSIASWFLGLRRRGAFLHFDRNEPINSSPDAVIRTLSYQLSRFHPCIQEAVSKELEENSGLETAPYAIQFERLLRKPLNGVRSLESEGPITIIIDALDECGDARSRGGLLEVLCDGLARLPRAFRILITSRDEFDIRSSLSKPNVMKRTIDTSDTDSNSDIKLYFQHSLRRLCVSDSSLSNYIIAKDPIPRLVEQAAGLFIWASTAIKFIGQKNPRTRLLSLLSLPSKRAPQDKLDALYKTALEADAFSETTEDEAEFYRSVLGAIVVARIPMTDIVIDEMLGSSEYTAASFLDHILCLVYWKRGETIRAMHASILDYLSDFGRSGSYPWFIEISTHHHVLSMRCFAIMNAGLHFNISGFDSSFHLRPRNSDTDIQSDSDFASHPDPPSSVNNSGDSLISVTKSLNPPSLAYATQYWADHAYRAVIVRGDDRHDKIDEGNAESLRERIDTFMHSQFLYWLEALSVLMAIPRASLMLRTTYQWIRVSVALFTALARC